MGQEDMLYEGAAPTGIPAHFYEGQNGRMHKCNSFGVSRPESLSVLQGTESM